MWQPWPVSSDRPDTAPTLAEAVGGPLGIAESALPAAAYVVAYTASGSNTKLAAGVAVGIAAVLAAARLIRRDTPRHALTGLIGVAIAAFVATRTGRAEDYFLPGLLANAGWSIVFAASALIRRPFVGVILGMLDPRDRQWRRDPVRTRQFTRATWLWAGLFALRIVVQAPLYLAGAVVALGVAKTAMGIPLFALGLWISYRLVRRPAPHPAA